MLTLSHGWCGFGAEDDVCVAYDELNNSRLRLQLHTGNFSAGAGRLALLGSEEKADLTNHFPKIISPSMNFCREKLSNWALETSAVGHQQCH